MKHLTYILALVCLISCHKPTIEEEATAVFDKVMDYTFSQSKGIKSEVTGKECVYTAPNDSLVIIAFDSRVATVGTATMYFAYVKKETHDESYWVVSTQNPIKYATDAESALPGYGKKGKDNLFDSLILLHCGTTLASGGGKTMKETDEMINQK